MFDQHDARAALAGDGGAHHAGGTGTDDGDVEVGRGAVRQGVRSALWGTGVSPEATRRLGRGLQRADEALAATASARSSERLR